MSIHDESAPRTALVTGGNSGLGFEIALALARQNFHVFIACRSPVKAARAVDRLRQESDRADTANTSNIEALTLDLASLDSVRDCADRFLARDLTLDVLVANAGIFHGRGMTHERFETIWGTNYLGHFLLVQRLQSCLSRSARILAIASNVAYRPQRLDWGAIARPTPLNFIGAYGLSKLCMLLWVRELQRRWGDRGVCVNAFHPGFVRSNITIGHRLARLVGIGVSAADAARAAVEVVADPARERVGDRFFDRHRNPLPWPKLAESASLAEELWERSQLWTGSVPVRTLALTATPSFEPADRNWAARAQFHRFTDREISGPYRLALSPDEVAEIARAIRHEVLPTPPAKRTLEQCLRFLVTLRFGSLLLLLVQLSKGEYYMERHLDAPAVQALARDPKLLDRLRDRLGKRLTLWRSEIWANYPAQQAVPFWHRDVYPKLLSGPGKSLNAYIALSDVTAQNGFEFVPNNWLDCNNHAVKISDPFSGNHLLTIDPSIEAEAKPIVLKAGEFVLFSDRLVHRSIRNTSGRVRLSIVLRVSQSGVLASGYTSAAGGSSMAIGER
ncbi:MAG: SDR family NAD(P)-dependent oxidoreductase [Geitlerinemataceae cyanobacterium]